MSTTTAIHYERYMQMIRPILSRRPDVWRLGVEIIDGARVDSSEHGMGAVYDVDAAAGTYSVAWDSGERIVGYTPASMGIGLDATTYMLPADVANGLKVQINL